MNVDRYCRRSVVAIEAQANILEAADLICARQTSFLVVFNAGDAARKPIGVLTDRDIVKQVVARRADPSATAVGDVMSRQPLVARVHDDLGDFLHKLRCAGFRRAPVVDQRGRLIGIIAANDVVDAIARMLDKVADCGMS